MLVCEFCSHLSRHFTARTFQPLLNSKPDGASGFAICPRNVPVSLRSRSITSQASVSSYSDVSRVMRYSMPYFAVTEVSKQFS